jgi:metallo-beta-lactamase family protein
MKPRLSFHGAAECVTGFCARLQTGAGEILVDCGMFQGPKTLKQLNYQRFPFETSEISAVLLTHAHLDHSGLLPKLVRDGFEGPIYATAGTRDLCRIMLADAADIQRREVEHLNRRNQQRGRPVVEPIYTERDVRETMERFETVKLGEAFDPLAGLQARYWDAGHILGAASIEVSASSDEGALKLLFSGDIGQGGREFARDPEGPAGVDHLILESTYGDRERMVVDGPERRRRLARELADAHAAGGPVLIPAFAVERAQELLVDILTLMEDGDIPKGQVFLDSPLAIEACEVYTRRAWNRSSGRNPFEIIDRSDRLTCLEKPNESDRLSRLSGWHIILAGSGMCDAGRIRGHLKRLLWRRETTVLITGFQAAGTLGRLLLDGRSVVRIQGDEVRVKARIRQLDLYSGHADANGLVAWAKARQPVAAEVFLAHGEPGALTALKQRLAAAGFSADAIQIPVLDQAFVLEPRRALPVEGQARILPGAATLPDWHNLRVELLADIDERLEQAGTDAERTALLKALRAGLRQAASADNEASR